ncbi:MAG: hypothetical protein Q8R57_00970 [Bacteroidota bacterium]|nr:hypothetical protein [Bacteroidota bacterium]
MKSFIKNITGLSKTSAYLREEIEKMKVLMAQSMVQHARNTKVTGLQWKQIEFSAFSQWGDDGIIQYLIHHIPGIIPRFIEFGVSNYLEANTRFLLLNDNWRGLIFDGSEANVQFIKNDTISWRYDLTSERLFVTKLNINEAITKQGFAGDLGILHIDIDGNDYWIWDCLHAVNPQVVIMEYNSVFGNKGAISVPYKDDFYVTDAHYSNLFFGASLKAMDFLAQKKGYQFIGTNTAGNNAYFLRNDLLNEFVPAVSVDDAYVACNFRQNRNVEGQVTLQRDDKMIHACAHLEVVDVALNQNFPLSKYIS